MIRREFLQMVINGSVSAEGIEFAKQELAKMDKANQSKASKASKAKAIEDAPIIAKILEVLTKADKPLLGSELALEVGITQSKAIALAKKVEGIIIGEVKVKGKGVRKTFALPKDE